MIFIYNFFILFYSLGIRIASLTGNEKARKWLAGRKDIFNQISSSLKPGEKRIWFHCASLGEFEQGRPVMEQVKMQDAACKIVLTFFSPSGYEVRKNYAGADYIFYLPMDTSSNAKRFVALIEPEKVFFVKYEFWYHYFTAIKQKNIPLYIISAIFRKEQPFFKVYGRLFRKMLGCVTHFFVQDEASAGLLKSIGFTNTIVNGDTRFDRVSAIASTAKQIPMVEKFKNGKRLFIGGSTWPQDDEIIIRLIESKPSKIEKYIIAPHEIGKEKVQALYTALHANLGNKVLLFSAATESPIVIEDAVVLIIDNIGMLSSLYRYADMALIGGGFGKSIHNVPEAAVFGMPVFFGPNFQKFKEARDLVQKQAAFPITGFSDLKEKVAAFTADETKWRRASDVAATYVKEQTGATASILKLVQ